MNEHSVIETPRLLLISMTPAFFEQTLAEDTAAASQTLGFQVPAEWLEDRWLAELRLNDLQQHPERQPWTVRAVVLRERGEMIGHIGFHTSPNPEYLHQYAENAVELGYTIFPAYRQQGFASEAFQAMMEWATREHGVRHFILSISPDNIPSRSMAARFGFRQIDTVIDEEDGQEDIYLLAVA